MLDSILPEYSSNVILHRTAGICGTLVLKEGETVRYFALLWHLRNKENYPKGIGRKSLNE